MRGRSDAVGGPGIATSLAGGTEVGKLGHALAMGAPEGLDGSLEDVDQGEGVAGIQRRQVDLGVASGGLHAASRSRQCGCRRTRLTCLSSTVRVWSRTASTSEPRQRLRALRR